MSLCFAIDELFLGHRAPGQHPERPERLHAALAAARSLGLEESAHRLQARAADTEEIVRVHSPAYLDELKRQVPGQSGWLDGDTYFCAESWPAVLAAAGVATDCAQAVLGGAHRAGVALVRPPGHHAEADRAMGFCMLNNVAIAAAALRAAGAERVAIIDWDVHHGNGTQHIFEADPSVFFCSLHQFPYYPGTGAAREIGHGKGEGATLNIPLPAGCGDAEYSAAFTALAAPALRAFAPDIILVSAGFDAHVRDPLAAMQMTNKGYGQLARQVRLLAEELCQGRVMAVLEGGYDLEGLQGAVEEMFSAWLPTAHPEVLDPKMPAPGSKIAAVVDEVRAAHGGAANPWVLSES